MITKIREEQPATELKPGQHAETEQERIARRTSQTDLQNDMEDDANSKDGVKHFPTTTRESSTAGNLTPGSEGIRRPGFEVPYPSPKDATERKANEDARLKWDEQNANMNSTVDSHPEKRERPVNAAAEPTFGKAKAAKH